MADLISRQAAIDAIMEKPAWHCSEGSYYHSSDIKDALEKLPSAQPERTKAEWILNKDGNWACPFCEFDPYHDNMQGMNYCPNCGAKLEQESRL